MKKNRIYFVHIPKTGGSFITRVVQDLNHNYPEQIRFMHNKRIIPAGSNAKKSDKHWFYEEYDSTRLNGKNFPTYRNIENYLSSEISFSVIRNPFTLLYSYYSHKFPRGWGDCLDYHNFSNFKSFIDFYCNCSPEEWHIPALNRNIFSQIFDKDGNSKVLNCIFFENIETGIKTLLGGIIKEKHVKEAISRSIAIKKKKKNLDYFDQYDREMIRQVENKCTRELEIFNYGFREFNRENIVKDMSRINIECYI